MPDDPFVPFEEVARDTDIRLGVPVGLRDTLAARHVEPEHRRVTIAFLHFDGTDELVEVGGAAEAADQLDELVRNVQTAADRHDVTFLATDVDHDGGKIILTAGAPSTSGDDDNRMLLCVREVMDAGSRLPIRIGVNRGAVFVGEIGPHYRRTFTVMGDAVNLAARLMAKARPGQIVVSPDVLSRSRTSFATEELEPFLVKGKAKPVRAFLLGPVVGERDVGPVDELPFVGRRAELEELERRLAAAAAGTGQLVELVGEPGSGKSRLMAELESRSQWHEPADRSRASTWTRPPHTTWSADCSASSWACRPRGATPPRPSCSSTSSATGRRDVLPWAPLIARAIGVPVEDTDETRDLDEEFRRPRLAQAVVDLLAGLLPTSGVLCIDDAHFMDEASADLFGHLAEAVGLTSWLICIARRDLDGGFTAPDGLATRVDVGPLDRADALELAHRVTSDRALSPRAIDALVDRSGGNPLFLRELLAAALAGGDVDNLPDTVDGVVAARIDSLATDDRFLLRQLSVLGQSFPIDLARDALDELPHSSDPVWRRLDEFVSWAPGHHRIPQRAATRQRLRRVVVPPASAHPPRGGSGAPGRARRRDPSRSSSHSTSSMPSSSRRPGSSRSRPPHGPGASTPTSRPPSSTSGRSRPAAASGR